MAQGWNDDQLAIWLGIAAATLPRLALCACPRPDHQAEDLAAIVAYTGVRRQALEELV